MGADHDLDRRIDHDVDHLDHHLGADMAVAAHVLESSPDGILVVERGGRIVYANRSMIELTGSDAALTGRCVDELVPDAARAGHGPLRSAYEASPSPRPMGAGMELSLRRVDGTNVPVEVSLSPFENDAGSHVIASVRDVSERRRSDRRLGILNEQLVLIDERERIGRDLHDVILQRLYGAGMTVQAIAVDADDTTADRLGSVVTELDRIITEVRTIVFTLGTDGRRGTLGRELADIVARASRLLGFIPQLRLDGPVESVLSVEARTEMTAAMREALGNVARHASASRAEVVVTVAGARVVMTVTDDGIGPPDAPGQPRHGNGLLDLRARAAALEGTCMLSPGTGGGAVLTWAVPY